MNREFSWATEPLRPQCWEVTSIRTTAARTSPPTPYGAKRANSFAEAQRYEKAEENTLGPIKRQRATPVQNAFAKHEDIALSGPIAGADSEQFAEFDFGCCYRRASREPLQRGARSSRGRATLTVRVRP
jgi:hypothetical protein